MQSVIINNNQAGQRLDKFLHKYLPEAGNGFLYKMLRKKNITLNGKKAEGNEILGLGDQVCFFFSEETFAKFSGKTKKDPGGGTDSDHRSLALEAEGLRACRLLQGIEVLYEDEDVLILNKPAGVLTQKATAQDVSLNEWLVGYLLARHSLSKEELGYFRPAACNRLDRNTSGVVLCGKSLAGLQYLSGCVRERTVRKFYRTICVGALRESAVVRGYLVKDREKNKVAVRESGVEGEGEMIQTAYTPLAVGKQYTLLEVELVTGRSHQIRAHLASIGHPLIGDFKYGRREVNEKLKETYQLEYQLLHACRVEFPQGSLGPGKRLGGKAISAPCPELFLQLEKDFFEK